MVEVVVDPHPEAASLDRLFRAAWGSPPNPNYVSDVLSRSLAHVGAFDGDILAGFVNVAWDGGIHAFILDTAVDPTYRRRGIATQLVRRAAEVARERGAHWLHVDFEPHLAGFYRACGFRLTEAGLIRLAAE
jgi:ribosomal protein S18 acetylase RimI-like enzyme